MIDGAPTRAWLAASLLMSLAALAGRALAQPAALSARVIWVREQSVYIASTDSIALEPGELLTFVSRGRPIALGEVSRIYEGELAVARLTSGSLRTVKKLDRLRILAQRSPLRAAPVLRVGYPARNRSNLLFACDQMNLRAPLAPGAYRADAPTERSFRLVRDLGAYVPAPWPETLTVRLFDEVADEEIALERGEIDAAVFWPGELSPHLREQPRWQGFLWGTRTRGVVAADGLGPAAPADSGTIALPDRFAFAAMNQELFRGDLAPWGAWAGRAAGSDSGPGARPAGRARFEVDPSCPGGQVLERFLNRGRRPQTASDRTPPLRVFYVDAPIHDPDSLFRDVARHARRGFSSTAPGEPARDSSRAAILFAIRCPLVCAPRLRPYLSALGTDALVNLLDCQPASRQP